MSRDTLHGVFADLKATLSVLLVLAALANTQAQDNVYPAEGINNQTVTTQLVPYTDATGASLQGFLAYDNSSTTPRGLVVIVPDWDGIGNYERWRAQLLASLGYAAFVADIYTTSVNQGPTLPMERRQNLTRTYSGNQTLLVSRLNGALDTAKRQGVVDPTKVVAIGYCFGGGAVMQLARSYPSDSVTGLKGVVSFHGSQLAQKTGDRNFTQGNPIAINIYNGYRDQSNNASQIDSIQKELDRAQMTFSFTNFGRTVHAFTEPELAEWTPATTSSQAYTEFADVASWWGLRSFLLYVFGTLDQTSNMYTGDVGVWDTNSNAIALY